MDALVEHEVLKDCFPSLGSQFTLQGELHVEFGPGNVVAMGNELTPTEAKTAPLHVIYTPNEDLDTGASYCLVVTDPDAPSRSDPRLSEICHAVQTGIRFTSPQGGAITGGDHVLPYIGPGPPKGTGLHRYVFLLFKELKTDHTQFTSIADRYYWGYGEKCRGAERWAAENNLELLSVNFFQSQNESN
ncbi:YbhB/YbcL family Raf kinase inhibitor-like protein KNAG_0F03830 [Huiozyma naganishii CBS 8797]|uniref:Phosphatidylethanolamine-binding protein n=1 Tax=Huiozyma naganishii (strain ATCC MYA-139 / BCRC 22969 / CBS 8797 / KCTC 17520 / NBRC 10181 / NCYC 3082 / Yp74L-3) TaxID=1071383 RepID=J7S0L6_HUIN7|nr:hypothetical protein KNAG_0F03830 [Kazachstania naganishii CBS 8797]CCK71047.1 hypothetical protein KNAG_0F03830 [Kazachstania naganishii CBS 8797]